VGSRLGVQAIDFISHPFQLIAKGNTDVDDVVLLSMGSTAGPFEGDPDVNWVDNANGRVEFTLTPDLLTTARQSLLGPGYRCGVHSNDMRGDFQIFGGGERILNPITQTISKGSATIELGPVAQGLASPLGLVAPADGSGRRFILDQAGIVYFLGTDGALSVFLSVSARLATLSASYDERGLLGLAFHPQFSENGKLYTYTSEPASGTADFSTADPLGIYDHQSVVAEWTVESQNPDEVDAASRRELLRIDEPQNNHNGGGRFMSSQ